MQITKLPFSGRAKQGLLLLLGLLLLAEGEGEVGGVRGRAGRGGDVDHGVGGVGCGGGRGEGVGRASGRGRCGGRGRLRLLRAEF